MLYQHYYTTQNINIMYSEDLYAAHQADNSVFIIYCTFFALMVITVLLKMVFNSDKKQYAGPAE